MDGDFFKDKVVLITGASSGIGRALVSEVLQDGAFVVLAARSLADMQKAVEGYDKNRFMIVKTDVAKESDCARLLEKATTRFGRLDVLINNAGVSMRALFADAELSVLERLMQVNFWGAVYSTKYALPHLLRSGGSVVGVSSIAGYKGLPARSGYSASKFALQGFLECLRIENRKTGLHVLIACPGFTSSNIRKTALSKDGSMQGESPREEAKMMPPETVARHMLRAVAKRKRTLVLTRQGRLTVWLSKFFPAWTDKLVYDHMAKEPDSPFA